MTAEVSNPSVPRLLLDQGLPRSPVELLKIHGIEAEHVAAIGMASASDLAIMEEARRRGATVVTLDSDFHQQLAESGSTTPSVIRIRIEGL